MNLRPEPLLVIQSLSSRGRGQVHRACSTRASSSKAGWVLLRGLVAGCGGWMSHLISLSHLNVVGRTGTQYTLFLHTLESTSDTPLSCFPTPLCPHLSPSQWPPVLWGAGFPLLPSPLVAPSLHASLWVPVLKVATHLSSQEPTYKALSHPFPDYSTAQGAILQPC